VHLAVDHQQRLRMAVDTAQHGCTFYIAGEGDMLRLDDIHVEDHNPHLRSWQEAAA
jgi:hypothetical protein